VTIPKIIHQTARNFDSISPEEKQNVENLKALNPGWEHRFYSDADIIAYVKRHYSDDIALLCQRINPKYGVVLADLFRYMAIHREGGVYLDIKSACTLPFDDVLMPNDQYILSQWDTRMGREHVNMGNSPELARIPGGEFQQWYIAATPRHPFLRKVIQDVLFNIEYYNQLWFGVGHMGVLRVSGPICYSLAIAPMLALCRHRFVDAGDLGLSYSTPNQSRTRWSSPDHYSKLREPVVLQPSR